MRKKSLLVSFLIFLLMHCHNQALAQVSFEEKTIDSGFAAWFTKAFDFDSDGDLDIISVPEEILRYKPDVFSDRKHPLYEQIHQYGGSIVSGNTIHPQKS